MHHHIPAKLVIECAFPVAPSTKATCVKIQSEWAAFRADYIFVDEEMGKHFQVCQISINRFHQINFNNGGFLYNKFPPYVTLNNNSKDGYSVSALLFKDRPKLRLDTCAREGTIEIVIMNTSTEPQKFEMTLEGLALE